MKAGSAQRWEDVDPFLADPAETFVQSWASGCEPEPRLLVSEWSNRNRILPDTSPEPGPYRWERTPYVCEILDNLAPDSGVEKTVVIKGTQLGLTTAGENFVGYVIAQTPAPFLYVQPTREIAAEVSKVRLAPMIADSPKLRALVSESSTNRSENTILLKEFAGGYLALVGANSAVGFRNRSVRFLFLDEIDGYPPDVGGEGDPVTLAYKRTDTFTVGKRILITSTPTIKGASRIENEFEETDKRLFEIPCPYCGVFQAITYAGIVDFDEASETALLECVECQNKIDEGYKPDMLEAGRWVPTVEPKRPSLRGYHISALYSPWKTWGQCVAEHKAAKRKGREELQTWVNTVLAETWEDDAAEPIDEDALAGRREKYAGGARVPFEGLVLTCGVDIQEDRVELEVVAWGDGEESYGIEYRVLWGDTAARVNAGVWPDLDEFLETKYRHAAGFELPIAATCIDSGFRTQQVYSFCKGKSARRIFAVKGDGARGLPIVSGSPRRKRSGHRQRKVDLFIVGTDQASSVVHSRLNKTEGFGVCHWPSDGHGYDLDYFRQMGSMRAVIRYKRGVPFREWHLRAGRRNEAFDCRVYALSALQILNVNFERLAARRDDKLEADDDQAEEKEKQPRKPRRRRKSWATRWKDEFR